MLGAILAGLLVLVSQTEKLTKIPAHRNTEGKSFENRIVICWLFAWIGRPARGFQRIRGDGPLLCIARVGWSSKLMAVGLLVAALFVIRTLFHSDLWAMHRTAIYFPHK